MLSHKAVSEAVSFAVPDEIYGQEIHAAIVLRPNAHITERDLQTYIATKVAKFKVPKKVNNLFCPSSSLAHVGDGALMGDLFY
jgi:oxalate---CoA ligase